MQGYVLLYFFREYYLAAKLFWDHSLHVEIAHTLCDSHGTSSVKNLNFW